MTATVILNPYSNRWNARERWPAAAAALTRAGVDFEVVSSDGPQHARKLAEVAAKRGQFPIIAAGGDGTIGEVVNGLARAQGEDTWGPMGILPLGSANDMAYSLNIPTDLSMAADVIGSMHTRLMDIGKVGELYFANNSAVGIEPFVTTIQVKITAIKGMLRYLVAAVRGIWQRPSWNARLEWDNGVFEGPISLMTVGIGSRSGGVFYMIPHADPFDGKLTFVYGHRSGRIAMFQLLPRAMRATEGSYVDAEGIHEISTTRLKVHLEPPSPAHTDGELFLDPVTDLEYSILPAKLRILVPGY
jgi:diacylglycerol kinase (ATP)